MPDPHHEPDEPATYAPMPPEPDHPQDDPGDES